jgi:hypothetical protein
MPIIRLALDEVRVRSLIYSFIRSDIADQFQTCLLFDDLGECETRFPPVSRRLICFEPNRFPPSV